VAGGTRPDLGPGEEKLPATQAAAPHACEALGDRSRSQSRLAGTRALWRTPQRFHRTGDSDRPRCAWQLWLAVPGPLPNRLHTCSRIWSGGERMTMVCLHRKRCRERSCSLAKEGAPVWGSATERLLLPWQPAEPPEDGRRARGWLALCRRFPLESHPSSLSMQAHKGVKGLPEEREWPLLGEEKASLDGPLTNHLPNGHLQRPIE
jgi:hypothetical protein